MSILFAENDITLFNPDIRHTRNYFLNDLQYHKITDVRRNACQALSWNSFGNKIFNTDGVAVHLHHLTETGELFPDRDIVTTITQYPQPANDSPAVPLTQTEPLAPTVTSSKTFMPTSTKIFAHSDNIISGSFFKDDPHMIFTYGNDNSVRLYDTRAKKITLKSLQHSRPITHACDVGNSLILFVDNANTCHVYDFKASRHRAIPHAVSIPSYSSLGLVQLQSKNRQLFSNQKKGQRGDDSLSTGPTPYSAGGTARLHSSSMAFPPITHFSVLHRQTPVVVYGTAHGHVFMASSKGGAPTADMQISPSAVTSVNASPFSTKVAVGAYDGSVNVLDPTAFTVESTIHTHAAPILTTRFSPDNSILASISLDQEEFRGQLTLSSLKSGAAILTMNNPVTAFDWHPSRLVYASAHLSKGFETAITVTSLKDAEIPSDSQIHTRSEFVKNKLCTLRHAAAMSPSAGINETHRQDKPTQHGYTTTTRTSGNGRATEIVAKTLGSYSVEIIHGHRRPEVQKRDGPRIFDPLADGAASSQTMSSSKRDALLSSSLSSGGSHYDNDRPRGVGHGRGGYRHSHSGGSGSGWDRDRDRERDRRYGTSSGYGGAGGHGRQGWGDDRNRDRGYTGGGQRRY